ncbi:diguanylate cyclase [Aquabacterium sp.]|uniref:GGDEF domain-containing protein n=1 Tax=Aquabacterium sp. TaxID=1872578 RepID=UPI0025BEF6A3|nr:GGDEF domain-containing protein [Aquabacterium sp.]
MPSLLRLLNTGNTADVFPALVMTISVIAAVAHLSFIMLFDSAGVGAMARINVASVLLYALAGLLVHGGRTLLAFSLVMLEVVAHGVLAVWVVGWDTGFHYYIILIVPVAIVGSLGSARNKAVVAVLAALFYMGLDVVFRKATPLYALPSHVLNSLHYFNLASTLLMLGLFATVYYRLVAEAQARLHDQACTDPLTQLRNRRFALEAAQHEAAVFARDGRPLALVMGDVDHFKRVNDQHGHEGGDMALKAVAQTLKGGVREIDHVARWGGEEFLLLLPGTAHDEARHVAERLRRQVSQTELRLPSGLAALSITLGVSILAPGETVEQALARADRALYEGKERGRNRVIVAPEPDQAAQV